MVKRSRNPRALPHDSEVGKTRHTTMPDRNPEADFDIQITDVGLSRSTEISILRETYGLEEATTLEWREFAANNFSTVTPSRSGDAIVLLCTGRFDSNEAIERFRKAVHRSATRKDFRVLIADVRAVSSINADAIFALVYGQSFARSRGGGFWLAGPKVFHDLLSLAQSVTLEDLETHSRSPRLDSSLTFIDNLKPHLSQLWELERHLAHGIASANSTGHVTLNLSNLSRPVDLPTVSTYSRDDLSSVMHGEAMIVDQKVRTIKGTEYIPVTLAAWLAQTSEGTLRRWIGNGETFGGHVLHTYISPLKELYLSDRSVRRVAQRFIKWPSKKPASQVTLGELDDQSGYIGIPDAANMLGISRITLLLWAQKGETPWGKDIDVVKCPISEHLYLRQTDIEGLKDQIKTGLRRGPKARVTSGMPIRRAGKLRTTRSATTDLSP